MTSSSALVEADFGLLAKLTLVIYTYDRDPSFALRIASHWQETGARVLVMHNGPIQWSYADISRLMPGQSYHFSECGYAQQMAEVGSMLNTPFAVRMDDDNMLIPHAAVDCIRNLEVRNELIGSTPRAALFGISRNACEFVPGYVENEGFSNEHLDSRVRVNKVLVPYHIVGWYAVQRSYVFSRLSCLIADVMKISSCPYASEVAAEVGYAWIGPSTTSGQFGILRSLENPPHPGNQRPRSLSFTEWWTAAKFESEVVAFLGALQEHLLLNDIDLGAIQRVLDEMVCSSPQLRTSRLRRTARATLPDFVWGGLQRARARMHSRAALPDARDSHRMNELLMTPGLDDLKAAIEGLHAK